MPRILEFSRKISIFIAEKISLCEGEKEKDLARKTVNSNCVRDTVRFLGLEI